jgi:membrane fusion protein (multidrug efflux system)
VAEDQDKDQGQAEPKQAAGPDEGVPEPPPSSSRRLLVIGVVLVLVLGAIFFYWRSTFTEDTDDAQVDGNLYQVSSRITGHVVKVYVDDNQTVQTGQLLVEIDPTDYQVALDQAQADLANAQAQYAQASTNVPITSTTVGTNRDHDGLRRERVERHGAQDEKQVEAAMARVIAGAGQPAEGAGRCGSLHAAGAEGRDLEAAIRYGGAGTGRGEGLSGGGRGQCARSAERRLECAATAGAVAGAVAAVGEERPGQIRVEQSRAAAAAAAVKQAEARVEQAQAEPLVYAHRRADCGSREQEERRNWREPLYRGRT